MNLGEVPQGPMNLSAHLHPFGCMNAGMGLTCSWPGMSLCLQGEPCEVWWFHQSLDMTLIPAGVLHLKSAPEDANVSSKPPSSAS